MRSKNSKPIDALESAYLRDVKCVACVVCDAPPFGEAHHPEQGLHYLACAVCPDCHGGPGHPHGWHGDKSRWRAAKMTEMKAINLTRRRVEELRAGVTTFGTERRSVPKPTKTSTYKPSHKTCPRPYANQT